MLGIIIYLYFLVVGVLYTDYIFRDKDTYYKLYSGLLFGNLILMFGIMPFALIFKFTYLTHIILIIAAALPYIYLVVRKKVRPEITKSPMCGDINHKVMLALILPITLLTWILLTNHIMAPYGDGAISSGQSTYGDLAIHMGMITSIADQGFYPPEYNIVRGARLCYPFLINSLSSSLYLFGTPLRWAILIPSYVFTLLLVAGFYLMAVKLTGKKSAAVLATVFFFLGGGLGFAYFFEGAKSDPTNFTMIFNDYYHTPTNYNEMNIRWANPICDMIIPQRTTMAGWTVAVFMISQLAEAVKEKKFKTFVILGITAGMMPMIHTHSFVAIALISAVLVVIEYISDKDRKGFYKNWLTYAGIAVVMALPQMILWTFSQASGEGFMQLTNGWGVNENDPGWWFWIKNWGIAILLLIPAFIDAPKLLKKMLCGAVLIFILAQFIQFQPLAYDNNKLFFIAYMIVITAVSMFCVTVYERLKSVKSRPYFAVLIIILGTLSGVLTIGREWKSGGMYQTFSADAIAFGEYVEENTDEDATFLCSDNHLNPVYTLAGRSLYQGVSLFNPFHGLTDITDSRAKTAKQIYTSTSASKVKSLCEENEIKYIVIGSEEKSKYTIKESVFSDFTLLYNSGGYKLYEIY